MRLIIGIDDVDSPHGMCTTYTGALIAEALNRVNGVSFLDYPYLVRLNPNIPFKTRGNGAVSFSLNIPEYYYDELKELILRIVNESILYGGRKPNPVVVFSKGINHKLKLFYERALSEVVTPEYARKLAERLGIDYFVLRGNDRGIVGALAAVGAYPLHEYTFELLVYRNPRQIKDRKVSYEKIKVLDRKFREVLFANIDFSTGRLLVVPHGPDPVLLGIRSVNPIVLNQIAKNMIDELGDAERWIIYKTNQGTGAHLRKHKNIASLKPYDSCKITGSVLVFPTVLRGGHVKVKIRDESGEVDCIFYKETIFLNRIARLLMPGDFVEIGGGVRPASSKHGLTVNAETLRIKKLVLREEIRNPRCPNCNYRMKSAGKNKGFKCPKCGFKSKTITKEKILKARILEPGLYLSSPSAYRHLSKPKRLLGVKLGDERYIINIWHFP
ncbi:MAG: hypothetical protein DRJ44_04030 [Thermoprotei archaeon]|nr:MAG: hypothetical protein DRJ44_04030 [Thermoprotei archaeon]